MTRFLPRAAPNPMGFNSCRSGASFAITALYAFTPCFLRFEQHASSAVVAL